jgi:hypothetical protein
MAQEKEPRWDADPPPGFKPDGSSLIARSVEQVEWPEEKIQVGEQLLTPAEFAALQADEEDDDLSDLDDIEFEEDDHL